METAFYEISNLTIMEVHVGDIWEYYSRETEDPFDYFRFVFGSDKKLDKLELETLWNNGYLLSKAVWDIRKLLIGSMNMEI